MDQRLRLLLRRFQLSGDPEDAVKFANTALRAGDIIINVWVLTTFDNQHGDNEYGSGVELYFSEFDALHEAFAWSAEWLDTNEAGLADNRVERFEVLLKNFEDQLEAKNLIGMRAAFNELNEYFPRGVELLITEMPVK